MAYILTVLITIVLDQLTKIAVMANFKMGESRAVLGKIMSLTYVTNKGGAFGLFSNYPYFFVILAFILVVAGIAFIPKIWKLPGLTKVAFGLLVGGTVGNLIDRLRFGSVVDFIDFKVWPTFNVADIAICVGVGLLVIQLITLKDLPEETEENNNSFKENGTLKEQGTV